MKLSVIVPVYNTEEYLKECIDSILNQTLDLYEVIIVDDGSTDGSLDIINGYVENYSNVHAISQKNCGLGAARNMGLRIAKGEYIYFIDSDDILEKNALEHCYNLAYKNKLDMLIFESDIFESVVHIEKSPCYLCARMRRGHLYNKAKELGCNKIALGHHYDDVIETILMGMLYGGQVQTMMPKLHSTNFEGMELIRPMYLVREDDIKHWRDYNNLHFIQCACRFTDTCTTCRTDGSTVSKRMEIKNLIAELKKTNPFIESNIFKSVENVNLKTIVAYKKDGVKHSFLESYDKQ